MQKLIQKHTLTLEAAKSLIAFAILKAKELGVGRAIAVVDDEGHLICSNGLMAPWLRLQTSLLEKLRQPLGLNVRERFSKKLSLRNALPCERNSCTICAFKKLLPDRN
jgi:hypothetical protein